jgi:tetratricopeptide (TPR) repeat protein
MAPKKAPEKAPAPVASLEEDIPEEEEEGPGKAAFEFAVTKLSNLPIEAETIVEISGPFRTIRSATGPVSIASGVGYEASGWEWDKTKSIRLVGQTLWDDIVSKCLVVSVFDAKAEDPTHALIGKTKLDLTPLLHDQLEVSGELVLELTELYKSKWLSEGSPQGGDCTGNPEAVSLAAGQELPQTLLSLSVRVGELVGPAEDRQEWTIMTLGVHGVYSLPTRLTELGVTAPEELEQHQMKYQARMLGESLKVGSLAAPKEQKPAPPEGTENPTDETTPEEEMSEDERRSFQERFGYWVRFAEEKLVRYRGAKFINEFRHTLNHVGGVWFYFLPEEKPSTDPKKPNPTEIPNLAKHFSGKAWLEVKDLINPGVLKVSASTLLETTTRLEETSLEPTLESSCSFVRLTLEMNRGMAAPEPSYTQIQISQLVSSHAGFNRFPDSSEATSLYTQTVGRSLDTISQNCTNRCGTVENVVDELKKFGHYDSMRQELRNAMVQIFRERLRKDPNMVPGKPLSDSVREQFFADSYAYLKAAMIEVLDAKQIDVQVNGSREVQSSRKLTADSADNSVRDSPNRKAGSEEAAARKISEEMAEVSQELLSSGPRESAAAKMSREALGVVSDARERNARLAEEAEMVGNWSRAANLFQNRLLLNECGRDPHVWIEYAKFCMRARGRQASAEEALRQAVQLLVDGVDVSTEAAAELDLMLACLLLDRGRHDEALRVFRERHLIDMSSAFPRFLLGLGLFLADEDESEWRPLLEAVAKPPDWFKGLPDDKAVADKLRMLSVEKVVDPVPYAICLDRLLEFGLPSLVFTFLDQCRVLPPEIVKAEPIAVVDAKASMLERDWVGAAASLEPLVDESKGKKASQEVWRLAGEVHFQLQDFEKTLHELQTALSFEKKFDDPAVYIRWGSVLLLKKRWPKAKDAYLKSIHCKPTAEAWSGVARAAYQSQEIRECYEALREANLLDNERSDVWAQLCLVHLRSDSIELADYSFKQCIRFEPDSDELLLDIANECVRRDTLPEVAETAARLALMIRDSSQGHSSLAEAFAKRGQIEKAILEAQISMRLSSDQGDQRKLMFERALKWADDLGDPALRESLHAVQRLSDQQDFDRTHVQSP